MRERFDSPRPRVEREHHTRRRDHRAARVARPCDGLYAFAGRHDFNGLKHAIVPLLGLLANLLMLVTIFAMGVMGGGDPQTESFMALGIAGLWAIASGAYVVISNRRSGRSLLQAGSLTPAASAR